MFPTHTLASALRGRQPHIHKLTRKCTGTGTLAYIVIAVLVFVTLLPKKKLTKPKKNKERRFERKVTGT